MSNTISVERDENPENPRQDENLWRIAGWHGRYNIGDEQPKVRPAEHLAKLPKNSMVVPLYMLDHSGITVSTSPFSCPWDSGQVGHCWLTPKQIKEEYGKDTPENREKALQVLQAEVNTYDLYLKGDCWMFSIEDEDGECIMSCAGYMGDDVVANGMIESIEDQYLDQFLEAASDAGMTVDQAKVTEWKARAAAHQMKQDTPDSLAPAKPGPRV